MMESSANLISSLPTELKLKVLDNLNYEEIRKLLLVFRNDEAVLQKLHQDVLIHIVDPLDRSLEYNSSGHQNNYSVGTGLRPVEFWFKPYSRFVDVGRYVLASEKNPYNEIINNVKNLKVVCRRFERGSRSIEIFKSLISPLSYMSRFAEELEALEIYTDFSSDEFMDTMNASPAFQNLKKLKIHSSFSDDQIPYISLPYLTELTIITYSHRFVRPLELSALRTLTMESSGLSQLECLKYLVNLEYLNLRSNEITKLDSLELLVKLKSLRLGDNNIEVIEGLHNLINLEVLELNSNNLRSLEGLKTLSNLQALDLSSNNLERLPSDFLYLQNLKKLRLDNNRLLKLENMENLINLEILTLVNNSLNSLSGLPELGRLREIDLSNNSITVLETTVELKSLELLSLRNSSIEFIGNVSGFSNLQTLDLSCNQVNNMRSLDILENLRHLNLDYNKISKLDPLFNLSSLQVLSMQWNLVERLENLYYFRDLKVLNLLNNRISKIENLNQSTHLRELYLSLKSRKDEVSKIENLQHLPNLEILELDTKSTVRIENLSQLLNLTSLSLYVGKLEGIDDSFQYLMRDNSLNNLIIEEYRYYESRDETIPQYVFTGNSFRLVDFSKNTFEKKIHLWQQLKKMIEQR